MESTHVGFWRGDVAAALGACVILGLLLGGCATQKQARGVEGSGFLGDYSRLEKGEEGEVLLHYANPEAAWASYTKVLLDPVVFYQKVDDPTGGTPREDLQTLVDNFSVMIAGELSKDYSLVGEPGPGVMRIQAALTHVEKSHAGLQTLTSLVPVGIVVSTTRNFVTGKPSFVGEASVEFRITDAQTGEILGEAVDRRVGGQMIKASLDSWVDVDNILKEWSRLLRYRLCRLRGDGECEFHASVSALFQERRLW